MLEHYNGNLEWLKARTILYVVHGSRAYGTSRPTSDYDYKGIAVPPRRYFDGFLHQFNQAEIKKPDDAVVFDIRKFFKLAADCNPNIIEVLWVAPDDRIVCTPEGHLLVDHRAEFLSRKALYTFRGYAMAQLKRIRTHKKWLLNPPTHQPTRAEFDLPERTLIPQDQLQAAMAEVTKRIDGWEIDFGDLSEPSKIYIKEQIAEYLAEVVIGNDEKFRAAARLIGYDENFIELLDRERHYRTVQRYWKQYQEWRKTRNEARAGLEARYGYDCYLDDTEFLTERGWLRYDEIQDVDLLATLNQRSGRMEFQPFSERVEKLYSGTLGGFAPKAFELCCHNESSDVGFLSAPLSC